MGIHLNVSHTLVRSSGEFGLYFHLMVRRGIQQIEKPCVFLILAKLLAFTDLDCFNPISPREIGIFSIIFLWLNC